MAHVAANPAALSTPTTEFNFNSGFTQQSFLADDFNVTKFIQQCTANITKVMDEDFHKTLDLIAEPNDSKHDDENDDDVNDLSFPTTHNLTAENLRQLHNDLTACHEHVKQALISSFQCNYPQFLRLNESVAVGTESHLKRCKDSLSDIHHKYNALYQQLLRLLERVHRKSRLKADNGCKLSALKQVCFVLDAIDDVKASLLSLHRDFSDHDTRGDGSAATTTTTNSNSTAWLHAFQRQFESQIASAAPRKQYRLLQRSCRLERIAILLSKLSAAFAQPELTQHVLVKQREPELVALRKRFLAELRKALLESIQHASLLSLRSNLRGFRYLNARPDPELELEPERIVGEAFIKPKLCIPLTLFLRRSSGGHADDDGAASRAQRRQELDASFDALYASITEKLSVLFDAEVLLHHDFIADAVWSQLVEHLFNADFSDAFLSRGLPDLFHLHFNAVMRFFRKLQQLYFVHRKCCTHCEYDRYLYFHASSIKFRQKCNLAQYFLFRMPSISHAVLAVTRTPPFADVAYHGQLYLAYYRSKTQQPERELEQQQQHALDVYVQRLNAAKECLTTQTTVLQQQQHKQPPPQQPAPLRIEYFEYNYALPIFHVCLVHLLKCWDAESVWIWELSTDFLRLTVQILSLLYTFLCQQTNDDDDSGHRDAQLLVLVHADLCHFNAWLQYELVPLMEYRLVEHVANPDHRHGLQHLVTRSVQEQRQQLTALQQRVWNELLVASMVRECSACLHDMDEIADIPMQMGLRFNDDDHDDEESGGASLVHQSASQYVAKLFQPLKSLLLFANEHSLDYITTRQKNRFIWSVLNALSTAYWQRLQAVRQRLSAIRTMMQKRSKKRKKGGASFVSNAERAEQQLLIDCRSFIQQVRGFVNGLQRDAKLYAEKLNQEQQNEAAQKQKSSILKIKKKAVAVNAEYAIDNIDHFNDLQKLC